MTRTKKISKTYSVVRATWINVKIGDKVKHNNCLYLVSDIRDENQVFLPDNSTTLIYKTFVLESIFKSSSNQHII